MKRLSIVFMLAYTTLAGAGTGDPRQFGAHWARVSDRAEIELLVDELRALSLGHGDERMIRKHAAPVVSLQSLLTTAKQDRSAVAALPTVEVRGRVAVYRSAAGEELTFEKAYSTWRFTGGEISSSPPSPGTSGGLLAGTPAGTTFISTPISSDHGINRLDRSTTRSMLNRSLMSTTGKTASYYLVRYTNAAPFVRATYIQFVLDKEWNRILYGNLNHWIKSYSNVQGPSSIATDAAGHVYVGETGNSRISVFQIQGEEAKASLIPLYTINGVEEPADLAHSDNGTPLDATDDLLYIADPSNGKILKYALSSSGATLIAAFDGFDSPTGVLVGRWNGASSGFLYVIDKVGKRLRLFEDRGSELSVIREITGTYDQYFQSMKADHFGNVFLVDNMNSQVVKYTADLEFLDRDDSGQAFTSPGYLDIPFGRIEIEGEEPQWAGFDQLFAAERWGETSGAQRRRLGIGLKNVGFSADADVSSIRSLFTLTDFGSLAIHVYDASNNLVRTIEPVWMISGDKEISWDRRDSHGRAVPPGTYRFEIEAQSAYRDEPATSRNQFYLPMYYWQNCGAKNDDGMLVQGNPVVWGSGPAQTANEHATSVQYVFAGLKPDGTYKVAVEYVSADGVKRLQDLTAGGTILHSAMPVTGNAFQTGYLEVPANAYNDGKLTLSVNRRGEGTAIVSQIWLKETGAGFSVQQLDGTLPTSYSLGQNYPNPFNPSTVIRYAIPLDGVVSLKVYDITGREVATLVNEAKAAGTYEATFDIAAATHGRGLASGVYLYRVQVGQFSEAKKMILLK